MSEQDKKSVLNIDVQMTIKDEVSIKVIFNDEFRNILKEDKFERKVFIAELLERLDGYIDGAIDEQSRNDG